MKPNYYLLLALLLSFSLRLYRADTMALRADEATNLYLAAQEPSVIARVLLQDDPHAPLYYFVLHYWLAIAGQSELALRFPNALTGVLVVAILYALARRFFPNQRAVALLAALFAAVNPMLIWDAQDAYMYSLFAASILLSLLFFVHFTNFGSFTSFRTSFRVSDFGIPSSESRWQGKSQTTNYELRITSFYILTTTAAFHLHYFALFPQLAQGALWLYWSGTRQISRRASALWLAAQSAAALLFLPWLIAALPFLTGFESDFFPRADWFEMLWRTWQTFTVGRVDARLMPPVIESLLGNVFAVGFLLIFGIGLLLSLRDRSARAPIFALVLFLLVSLFSYYLFSTSRFPVFDERYVIYLTPIFLLLFTRAVFAFGRLKSVLLVAFFLLAHAYSLNNYYHVPAFAKSPDWRALVRELNAHARAGDALIQNYPDPALPYYLQARLPRVLLPRASPSTRNAVALDLEQLAQKYDRFWLQPVPFGTWDTEGYVIEWLTRHTRLVSAYRFRGVDLSLYLSASAALKQAQTVDTIFDARVRLRAFELIDGVNRRLVLYWQTLTPLARDYTVFVHLYDSFDQLVWQRDTPPVAGTYPTREWRADKIVVDEYALELPHDVPRGRYRVMVGLYDSETRARLSAIDANGHPIPDNRILLTTLDH